MRVLVTGANGFVGAALVRRLLSEGVVAAGDVKTLLLLDPATASIAEHKRAAEVIAHELAHMWYGDLVTMAWWDDLWLNEAFATWMAYRVVDDWRPEWRMWHGFEHDRSGALAQDALRSTHPIYAPVRSVAEATENTTRSTPSSW